MCENCRRRAAAQAAMGGDDQADQQADRQEDRQIDDDGPPDMGGLGGLLGMLLGGGPPPMGGGPRNRGGGGGMAINMGEMFAMMMAMDTIDKHINGQCTNEECQIDQDDIRLMKAMKEAGVDPIKIMKTLGILSRNDEQSSDSSTDSPSEDSINNGEDDQAPVLELVD